MPRIAFVGLGYVGLSTAACFAHRGFQVHGIDVDAKKLELIRRGVSPIHEKGLESLLLRAVRGKKLTLGESYEALASSDVIFLTVGTPSAADGGVNTSYLESASKEVGRSLASAKGYHLVVVKSTVIPGTTEGVVRPLLEGSGARVGERVGLASNPEFLHEGAAVEETFHPDALVIGGVDLKSTKTLARLYRSFYKTLPPTISTSPANAEMMKYAINVGRVTQLGLVNTVANLCSRTPGADYDEVRKGLSQVARMDSRYLSAGLGFGGSCLGKDARALAAALRSAGVSDAIVSSALRVNEGQVAEAIRMAESIEGELGGKRVSVLGLAFKAGTDDVRESVAVSLALSLAERGADVAVYDPAAMENSKKALGSRVEYAKSASDCLMNSECAFVATGWEEFKMLKPRDFRRLMAVPFVVDGRRIYDPRRFAKEGVRLSAIGTGERGGTGAHLQTP